MKKLLDISSEERNRILEMHQSATRKNYLTEAPQQATQTPLGSAKIGNVNPAIPPAFYITSMYDPGETINTTADFFVPEAVTLKDRAGVGKIFNHTLSLTDYGKKLGLDQSKFVVKKPVGTLAWGTQPGANLGGVLVVNKGGFMVAPVTVSFPAPQTPFKSDATTAKQPIFTITFETNDKQNPKQTLNGYFLDGSGVAVGAKNDAKPQ